MADPTPGTPTVTDHRQPPRGVMPRGMQTWLMIGLAVAILAIIALTGQPTPAASRTPTPAAASLAPSPDRLRDYQDRLRTLDERARAQQLASADRPAAPQPPMDEPGAPAPVDPVDAERKRREYESLFASNVVVSRRQEGRTLMAGPATASAFPQTADAAFAAPPSLDDVAAAVVRATQVPTRTAAAEPFPIEPTGPADAPFERPATRPAFTGPISSTGPMHRITEGTVIEAVLTNRLDGSVAAPVNCLVASPVYSHDGQRVLIPAGSRVLGETQPVQSFGESRLAVAFSRLVLPDGSSYRLDQFVGLNDIGESGLRDRVNRHYRSTFGASAAIGLLTGFAHHLGSRGLNTGDGDRTVVIAGNVGDSAAQATAQTMNRFLNRMPNITIREGHRVKVYVTNDLELPAYESTRRGSGPLLTANR